MTTAISSVNIHRKLKSIEPPRIFRNTGLIALGLAGILFGAEFIHRYNQAPTSNLTSKQAQKETPQPKQEKQSAKKAKEESKEVKEARETILSYLAQPDFANSDFSRQVTNTNARLEFHELDEDMLYFSMRAVGKQEYEIVLQRLANDRNSVEFAVRNSADVQQLSNHPYQDNTRYFFRFPTDSFRVNPKAVIRKKFPSLSGLSEDIEYTITIPELRKYLNNENVHNGPLGTRTGVYVNGLPETISNHGAFVAKPNEPSLERLVAQITQKRFSLETQAQDLLDFVTRRIDYSNEEANAGVETLKRPNEVFMSGNSDCSGHVIAYASLLEQIGADYRLIYVEDKDFTSKEKKFHIAVAVSGNFLIGNGMNFKTNGKIYSIAETTAKGFIMGESRLDYPITLKQIKYVQQPGKDSRIYDAKTGKPLDWL